MVDWFSRRVLAWRLSITIEADFCIEALEEALARYGRPDIFNTDQGSQFTSTAFIAVLTKNNVVIRQTEPAISYPLIYGAPTKIQKMHFNIGRSSPPHLRRTKLVRGQVSLPGSMQ